MHHSVKKAVLKPGKEVSLLRKHPWVFSGAIQELEDAFIGDWVQVFDSRDRLLGTGQVGDGSIAIRMVAFEAIEPGTAFWQTKLANCLALRKQLGFGLKTPPPPTDWCTVRAITYPDSSSIFTTIVR